MRTWFSLLAVVAAVAFVEPARADSPADVYTDFATDGVLNCGHSKSALKGILNDASIYQYGNPLTFLKLKLAIRRQLAGGCNRRTAVSSSSGTSALTPGATEPADPPAKNRDRNNRGQASEGGAPNRRETVQSNDVRRDGAMVILGAGLLLVALGSGGWAAKRAFTK